MNIEQIKKIKKEYEDIVGKLEKPTISGSHIITTWENFQKDIVWNFIEQKLNLVVKEAEQNAYRRMIDEYKYLFGMGLPFYKVISSMASKFINSSEGKGTNERN